MLHLRVLRRAAALFVALCVALILACRSGATSIRISLPELNARSTLVVSGRVERIAAEWLPDRTIESTVYLRVREVARGDRPPGALIPIRVRGGTVDGMTMVSSVEPTFGIGEDVYLFLAGLPGGAYRVAEGEQGKFAIVGDHVVNAAWQTKCTLADLQAGVCAGDWPVEPAAASPDGYVVNGQRWPGPRPMEENYVITVNTGDAGGGNGSGEAFRNAIIASGNVWGNAGANFAFHYGGGSGITSSGNDGQNVVHWENLGSGSTLAESTWWYQGDQIVEADIRFNDYYTWDTTGSPSGSEVDLQSVSTHELGHWLSLGHDTDPGCPNASAVMCASYKLGTLKRALSPNDVAGIKAIYGAAQAQATNTPRPPNTPTRTDTPTRTATPTRTPTRTRTPTPRPTLAPWQIQSRVKLPMILR